MLINTQEYKQIFNDVCVQIQSAQQQAVAGINRVMINQYWHIGHIINKHNFWGKAFIENLARDIKTVFPNMRGFSERNLRYMSKFASVYKDLDISATALQNLPWRHNILLMERLEENNQRIWYAEQALENGWSNSILDMQIDRELYMRQVISDKTTNFKDKLPPAQSDMTLQAMKDPYIFDFIENNGNMLERDIENELVKHIADFLLELGSGFSFVGRQYHLEIDDEDFYLDMLFYNIKLNCFVVIELKMKEFKPEYAGKLNFYVSAVDDLLKRPTDNPTIGILLCKKKKKMIAEYALRDLNKPISVNEFKLLDKLPKEYENILPTAEDIENRLNSSNPSNGKYKMLGAENLQTTRITQGL